MRHDADNRITVPPKIRREVREAIQMLPGKIKSLKTIGRIAARRYRRSVSMVRFPAAIIGRIDDAFRDSPYFARLSARLLAAFALLVIILVPCNIAKVLWVHPAEIPLRIAINAVMAGGAIMSL